MKRAALAVVVLATGCAYFNGVYNARRADRAGERALADGNDSAAARNFELAAAAAESVLSRHADSRWGTEALYLAGRGLAFSGQCGRALARLSAYAARARSSEQRDRAALASGSCLTADGRHSEALAVLGPLLESSDEALARPAARLSARAHLALGDPFAAARVLRAVDVADAEWLLVDAAIAARDAARAESLLVRRARAGDVGRRLDGALRALWEAGDSAAARRIGVLAIASRGPGADRARLRLTLGELQARAGRTRDALEMVAPAARQAGDSTTADAARDLELRLAIAATRTLPEAEAVLRRSRTQATGRTAQAMGLARILAATDPETGAGAFLAAEVMRDSLGAVYVARQLFLSLPPSSPIAAKGWLAAAELGGDSAASYVEDARRRWPTSGYVLALDGREPANGDAFAADSTLRRAWEKAIVSVRDSIASRPPPTPASMPMASP